MSVLIYLVPIALGLGLLGLGGFMWSLKSGQYDDMEGAALRVLTDDGWWLLRASNTQAVLVARAEARDRAGLGRLKSALAAQLVASGLPVPDFDAPTAGH